MLDISLVSRPERYKVSSLQIEMGYPNKEVKQTEEVRRKNNMRIACLLGSPRHEGNSATIAKRFIETAASLGAGIRTFELNRLTYRDCQGCLICKTKLDRCVLRDDLTVVLEAVEEADAIMLSTPVYIGDIPGQVKSFIDRTYSYMVPDYIHKSVASRMPPGKKAVLIITQGAPEGALTEVARRYERIMRFNLALAEFYLIHAGGVGPAGIIQEIPEKYLRQAEDAARAIVNQA
jgi:multimeric flavodoxin WrbA